MNLLEWLKARHIRRKSALHELPFGRFEVRMATTLREYEDAFRLVYVSYANLGISRPSAEGMRTTDHHLLSEAKVLVAYESGTPVGTMTVTFDSPAGLPLDLEAPARLTAARTRSERLCEFGSLAVVQRCRHQGVFSLLSVAASRIAFFLGDATRIVIGVNPRAVPFYEAVWGFESFGSEHDHPSLHAPVATLDASRDAFRAHVARHHRRPCPSGRTVADHIFDLEAPIPGCVVDPEQGAPPLNDVRMSREIFRSLFRVQTQRLHGLRPDVEAYVASQRSEETVGQTFLHRASRREP